jgi:hypothetical protein
MTTTVRPRRAPARVPETKPERPVKQAERAPDATRFEGRRVTLPGALAPAGWSDAAAYAIDAWQRGVLFLDALRERADNMLDHEAAGLPPPLRFKHETVLDARSFDPPANYALLHIIETEDVCAADCVDPDKPPVIVIDPRAGHGPGIGGFKRDSEVGIALHEGHEVYFVIFFPEPCPGQTLADVLAALRHFIEAVRERHGGKAPVLYGNCQAGWAAVLLAADCQGLTGPTVLNGSPLSYWAGESGVNPMRLFGGLLGGTWLAHLLADLGAGEFDGAWLVQNFELLKPEAAIWDKYANLFMNVDGERERFLEFERWWNGFYRLSREEIVNIVQNLFVGNKLEEGKVRICPGCYVDLRRIRNPLVIFASWGDNITPPQQALGWLPAVYESTDDLKAAGQRIVYLTNPHVGHLGIFVSAKVARFEHRAILESLDEIEALPPGLYEMRILNPTGDPDCRKPQYAVAFEARKIEDLRFAYPEQAFERARDLSERNEALYRAFVSPWVQAWSNPWTAQWLRRAHPMRASRYVFSERISPGLIWIKALAGLIGQHRQPAASGNPWLPLEQAASRSAGDDIRNLRTLRDELYEVAFQTTYGRE